MVLSTWLNNIVAIREKIAKAKIALYIAFVKFLMHIFSPSEFSLMESVLLFTKYNSMLLSLLSGWNEKKLAGTIWISKWLGKVEVE